MADPQKYRDAAARLRQQADEREDDDVRRQMIEIAELYDKLAVTLDKRPRKPLS